MFKDFVCTAPHRTALAGFTGFAGLTADDLALRARLGWGTATCAERFLSLQTLDGRS
jgi:hypothetical protein